MPLACWNCNQPNCQCIAHAEGESTEKVQFFKD